MKGSTRKDFKTIWNAPAVSQNEAEASGLGQPEELLAVLSKEKVTNRVRYLLVRAYDNEEQDTINDASFVQNSSQQYPLEP
ncbi:hypothetical protein SLA2020_432360 [Shorea laevis]